MSLTPDRTRRRQAIATAIVAACFVLQQVLVPLHLAWNPHTYSFASAHAQSGTQGEQQETRATPALDGSGHGHHHGQAGHHHAPVGSDPDPEPHPADEHLEEYDGQAAAPTAELTWSPPPPGRRSSVALPLGQGRAYALASARAPRAPPPRASESPRAPPIVS